MPLLPSVPCCYCIYHALCSFPLSPQPIIYPALACCSPCLPLVLPLLLNIDSHAFPCWTFPCALALWVIVCALCPPLWDCVPDLPSFLPALVLAFILLPFPVPFGTLPFAPCRTHLLPTCLACLILLPCLLTCPLLKPLHLFLLPCLTFCVCCVGW